MAEEQELDEIRRRVDIVDLIGHYVTLRKAGANYKAACPFHQEKTASFMVSPEKQIYKCFGCGEGGDVFGFIMKQETLTFPEAVHLLADRAGVQLTTRSHRPSVPQETKNQLYTINSLSMLYFQTILWRHPTGQPALEYLHKRGLTDATIKKFALGYAPYQKGLLSVLQKKGFSPAAIQSAGQPDRFFQRIMFPICDPLGNVVAFTGRVFPGEKEPKYLNTSETTLFHKGRVIYGLHLAKQSIKKEESVILVEGQMDVIASHQAGITNAVASSGTALTIDHFHILHRYSPKFILAFDNDSAGQAATEKIAQVALKAGYSISIVTLPPEAKDPGDLAIQSPEKWKKAIQEALPAVDWYFARAFKQFIPSDDTPLSAEAKKKIAKSLLPVISLLPDDIERTHYIQKLALKLNVKEEIILTALERLQSPATTPTPSSPPAPAPTAPPNELEAQILSLFIQEPELAYEFRPILDEDSFTKNRYSAIANQIQTWYNNIENKKSASSSANLMTFLQRHLDEKDNQALHTILAHSRYPLPDSESSDEPVDFHSTLTQSIDLMRKHDHEKRLEEYANAIARAEAAGDRTKTKQLVKEMQNYIYSSGGEQNGQKNTKGRASS